MHVETEVVFINNLSCFFFFSFFFFLFFFSFEGMDTVSLKKQDWKKGNCKFILKLLNTES